MGPTGKTEPVAVCLDADVLIAGLLSRTLADQKDVPILSAAIGAGTPLLVTHNVRHFRSGEGVRIVRPRVLIEEARAWMAAFGR